MQDRFRIAGVAAFATVFCAVLILLNLAPVAAQADPEASASPTPNGDRVAEPIITDISIVDGIERKNAKTTLRGKNLLPTKGSVTVSFTDDNGGSVSVSSFLRESPNSLVFELPDRVSTGNVTVKTTGELGTSKTSAPYHFEFHQPKILFVTGEEGIGPGKSIKIWGEYLDGVYMNQGGRTRVVPISTATLKGAEVGVNGNLSVIEMRLPEGDFQKDFWVERSCDAQGENCLESNKVTFSQVRPPILTDFQVDYDTRIGTVFGRNFPLDESDFSVSFDGKNVGIESYDADTRQATFKLPCPLPPQAEVLVKNKTEESNPLIFFPEDAPAILGIEIKSGEKPGTRNIEVAGNVALSVPATSACSTDDNQLRIGSSAFDLFSFGGKLMVKNVEFANIPLVGDATLVVNGIRSDTVDFRKEIFSPLPHIYRIESKYGLRQGTPFTIIGRNLGSKYKSCAEGETTINGPEIFYEEQHEVHDGYDEKGNDKFKTICRPIRPDVQPARIDAQFTPLSYGAEPQVGKKDISVSVNGKQSNSIAFTFGDTSQKVAYAAPEIRDVEFPKGRNIGDEVIIRGSGFGASIVQNLIGFGSVEVRPTAANSRGTELKAIIPESAGSDITVTRTIPEPGQSSESFPVVISKDEDSTLTFEIAEALQEDQTVTIEDARAEVTVAEMTVKNSIADMKINRFRMTMYYTDGDPEHEFSLKKLKIAPFSAFTLKLNGSVIAAPAAAFVSRGKITLEFLPFELPLTNGESDTLTVTTDVLRFITDDSQFYVTFDPQSPVDFLALNLDSQSGARPATKDMLRFGTFTIKSTADDLCIDTEASNIHCDNYLQSLSANKPQSQKQKQTTVEPAFNRHRQSRIALITSNDKVAKLDAQLLARREEVLTKVVSRVGEAIVDRIRIALEKRDERILENYADSVLQASREKVYDLERQAAGERNERREQIAEAKRKSKPIASQLGAKRTDSDRDGLTDEEEILLGTDPKSADTDDDGYSDFVEVEFGISPFTKDTATVFSDLTEAGPAGSSIARLYFLDILSGYDDGTFRPSLSTSRAQFITTLSRTFFGFDLPSPQVGLASDVTADVWFAPELYAAKQAGYLGAEIDATGAFRPHVPITRIEACRLTLQYLKANARMFNTQNSPITDVTPQNLGWATECVERKWINLTDIETGSFSPNRELTRAEMAVMAFRAAREQ